MPTAKQPMSAGALRCRVRIESASSTPDAFGQPSQSWTLVTTAWASITVITPSRDAYGDGQLASQLRHLILVRYQPLQITPGMRVVYGSHIYKIELVENVEQRNAWLQLTALELNAGSAQ